MRYTRLTLGLIIFLVLGNRDALSDEVNNLDTAHLYRRKVIVKSRYARMHKEPGDQGVLVNAFDFFFLIPNGETEELIQVGSEPGIPVGWLGKEDVLVWEGREVIEPRKEAVNALKLWSRDGKVLGLLRDLAPPRLRILPVLETCKDNSGGDVSRVAFLYKGSSAMFVDPNSSLGLDLVFVLQTTKEMREPLSKFDEVVRRIVFSAKLRPDVAQRFRIGAVEYRDRDIQNARIVSPLTADYALFANKLVELQTSQEENVDSPEDALSGLQLALRDMRWGARASRQIVLVGASSFHKGPRNKSGESIDSIMALAARSDDPNDHVLFHCFRFTNSTDADDAQLADKDFEDVASNGGRFSGSYFICDPTRPTSVEDTIDSFSNQFAVAFDVLAGRSVATDLRSPRDLQEYFQLAPGVRPNDKVVVGQAYVAASPDPKALSTNRRFLLLERDLKKAVSALKFLAESASQHMKADGRLDMDGMRRAVSLLLLASGRDDGATHHSLANVMPIPISDDFGRTIDELGAMSKEDLQSWIEKCGSAYARLDAAIAKAAWLPLHQPLPGLRRKIPLFTILTSDDLP